MAKPFMSSEEYDEYAHQLYTAGDYDQAIACLREGLQMYPNAVDLHIGLGYAHNARDEFLVARRCFEQALILDAENEDAMAGLGEVLLRFGHTDVALALFDRILGMGYADDTELMLQIGRVLFREGLVDEAKRYFEAAVEFAPDSADAVASVGYAQHRLGEEEAAITSLRRALRIDPDHSEARIYLGNVLYDRGEYEKALHHLERSDPEDHWDELGIWRLLELKKSIHRLKDGDPDLKQWEQRVSELSTETDDIDDMLAEIEARVLEDSEPDARGQLELFSTLLETLADQKLVEREHQIALDGGRHFVGTWEEIVRQMRDASTIYMGRTLEDFMATEARRGYSLTGIRISTSDAESFIRGSANAGLLRIVR